MAYKKELQSGGIEYIRSADERASDIVIKGLKGKHKGKSEGDLTPPEVRELVFAIAKHLKII